MGGGVCPRGERQNTEIYVKSKRKATFSIRMGYFSVYYQFCPTLTLVKLYHSNIFFSVNVWLDKNKKHFMAIKCSLCPRAAQLVVIRHVCGPVKGAKGITSQNTWVQGYRASYWYNISCVQGYATCANHRHNTYAHEHLARHDTDCVQSG